MSFPPGSRTTCHVHGLFYDANGEPDTGTITLTQTPIAIVISDEDAYAIDREPIVLELFAGAVSEDVTATDNGGTGTSGWTYRVDYALRSRSETLHTFAPAGESIDLTQLAGTQPVTPSATIVRTVGGVGPDTTGNVPLDSLVGYIKPPSGIPASDLAAAVQALLTLAGTAVQLNQLAEVALSGDYSDLTGRPAIPDSPDDIGAAAAVHTHTAAQITDLIATVDARVQLIVDAAPSALDTLNELAAALNDDPNFASTMTTALAGKIPLSLIDAAGDLLVGSGDNTMTRLAKGADGQVLTVVGGSLVYADPAPGGLEYDPGDDILGLYGFHSASAHISSFRSEFGQNNEIWIARVLVRAGRAINKIGTFVKTAGVLGVGGTNGFAIASDDGSSLLFSVDTDNLWESAGLVSVNLGGSAIPAQPVDTFYRVQLSVQGYSTAPIVLLNQGDHAVLSEYQGRARFANASAGFQGGGGYDPLTFGTGTGGFYPCVMLG